MCDLHPDEAGLLRAVCADRDADLPRLVYADFLDDTGRPERAEFIRLQIASAAAGYPGVPFERAGDFDPRQPRINQLWREHWRGWLGDLPKWAVGGSPPAFARGFPDNLSGPAAAFVRDAPRLLDRVPVRRLGLMRAADVWAAVVGCGRLRGVPELVLGGGGHLGDPHIDALVTADWLTGTRWLYLGYSRLTDRAAEVLAGCPRLAGLVRLDLSGNGLLTLAGVDALRASPHLLGCRFVLAGCRGLTPVTPAVRELLGRRCDL